MKLISLLVLCAFSAQAADDAPLATLGETQLARPPMQMKAGEVVPFDGLCMDDALTVQTGKRIASCEATLAKAEKSSLVSTPVLIALVAGALVVGLGAGYGIAVATRK